jgi:ABC-2 type transport system permease protein
MTDLMRVMMAFWRQHAGETFADRPAIVRDIALLSSVFAMCFFSGRFVDESMVELDASIHEGWFLYTLTGVTGMLIVDVTLRAFTRRVTDAQQSGLLEALVMTRTPLWRLLLVMPTFDVAVRYVVSLGVLVAGVRVAAADDAALGWAALVLGLGLLAMTGVGMISASISVIVKYTDPLGLLVALGSVVCGGVFYPREVLPEPLATMGGMLPIGPLVDGLRAAVAGDIATAAEAASRLTLIVAALGLIAPGMAIYGMRRLLADGALWRRRGPTHIQA